MRFLSLVKFSHSVFAMPFALLGFMLAFVQEQQHFSWQKFFLVVLSMLFARNVAMAFNRLIDADIDKKNQRTQNREIPAGIITKKSATIFIVLNAMAFLLCAYAINFLCFVLSPIALSVIMGYSYTKRFSPLCHLVLGVGLALAPIGSFLAVTAYFKLYVIVLGFGVLCWVSGFDIIYALQDFAFDKAQRLHSIPVLLGIKNARKVSVLLHCLCAICFLFVLSFLSVGYLGYAAWLLFCFFLIRQHRLINLNNLNNIDISFFTNNGIASFVFCGLLIVELLFF